MTCREYLAQHSDYLDEQLVADVAAQFRAHAAECEACARYDRVVRQGLRLARELPDVFPSADFHERLQHRIFHVQDEIAHERFASSGAAAALAIAGLIAFAAWSPLMRPTAGEAAESVARVEAAPSTEATAAGETAEPLRTPGWWYGAGMPGSFSRASAGGYSMMGAGPDPLTAFPGPYSPLIVSPPRRMAGAGAILARYTE